MSTFNSSTSNQNFYTSYMSPGDYVLVKFLPDRNPTNKNEFYIRNLIHEPAVPGQNISVVCPKTYDDNDYCPICDISDQLFKKGKKNLGVEYYTKSTYHMSAIILDTNINQCPDFEIHDPYPESYYYEDGKIHFLRDHEVAEKPKLTAHQGMVQKFIDGINRKNEVVDTIESGRVVDLVMHHSLFKYLKKSIRTTKLSNIDYINQYAYRIECNGTSNKRFELSQSVVSDGYIAESQYSFYKNSLAVNQSEKYAIRNKDSDFLLYLKNQYPGFDVIENMINK